MYRVNLFGSRAEPQREVMFFGTLNYRDERGVSLVEVLVVMVIVVIISALALFNGANANVQLQRQTIARELKVAFERSRFDSVKRRADSSAVQAHVVITASSFTLVTDTNQDGVLDATDDRQTDFAAQNIATSSSGAETIYFNRRGEPVDSAGANLTNVLYLVCNGACPAIGSETSSDANIVLVTPTGTVNLLPGGSAVPTFSAPTITTVTTDTGVNPDVVIP